MSIAPTPDIAQQAAAFQGLATNIGYPPDERLQLALKALDLYEAEVHRLGLVLASAKTELRDKGNDLLDVRGLLSPNGGESVLPADLDISERVAPAVEWLIKERQALLLVAEAAVRWFEVWHDVGPEYLDGAELGLIAAVRAWQVGGS